VSLSFDRNGLLYFIQIFHLCQRFCVVSFGLSTTVSASSLFKTNENINIFKLMTVIMCAMYRVLQGVFFGELCINLNVTLLKTVKTNSCIIYH